jgi:hypothetical protein
MCGRRGPCSRLPHDCFLTNRDIPGTGRPKGVAVKLASGLGVEKWKLLQSDGAKAAPSIVPEQPDSVQNQPAASNMRQSKDAVIPMLQLRHAEGEGWCVAARWPDGHVEDIPGFKSEFEANEWIAKDFQTWLETRRNGDQAKPT